LGLCQRVDAALGQMRRQCREDLGGGQRVAGSGVATMNRDAKPGRERVERILGKARIGDRTEQPHAKRSRLLPGDASAFRLLLQYGEIETYRMANQQAATEKTAEARQ